MIYYLSKELDKNRAIERFKYLMEKNKTIELKEKKPRRSISQNSYLHLILSWFGLEFGYSLEEVKQEIFKKIVNPEIFYLEEKEGLVNILRWKSTSILDSGELTISIDRFRDYSAKNGCYLPQPEDMALINEMEKELSKTESKKYL